MGPASSSEPASGGCPSSPASLNPQVLEEVAVGPCHMVSPLARTASSGSGGDPTPTPFGRIQRWPLAQFWALSAGARSCLPRCGVGVPGASRGGERNKLPLVVRPSFSGWTGIRTFLCRFAVDCVRAVEFSGFWRSQVLRHLCWPLFLCLPPASGPALAPGPWPCLGSWPWPDLHHICSPSLAQSPNCQPYSRPFGIVAHRRESLLTNW